MKMFVRFSLKFFMILLLCCTIVFSQSAASRESSSHERTSSSRNGHYPQRYVPSFSPYTPFLTAQSLPGPQFGRGTQPPWQNPKEDNFGSIPEQEAAHHPRGNPRRESSQEYEKAVQKEDEAASKNFSTFSSTELPSNFPRPADPFNGIGQRQEAGFLVEKPTHFGEQHWAASGPESQSNLATTAFPLEAPKNDSNNRNSTVIPSFLTAWNSTEAAWAAAKPTPAFANGTSPRPSQIHASSLLAKFRPNVPYSPALTSRLPTAHFVGTHGSREDGINSPQGPFRNGSSTAPRIGIFGPDSRPEKINQEGPKANGQNPPFSGQPNGQSAEAVRRPFSGHKSAVDSREEAWQKRRPSSRQSGSGSEERGRPRPSFSSAEGRSQRRPVPSSWERSREAARFKSGERGRFSQRIPPPSRQEVEGVQRGSGSAEAGQFGRRDGQQRQFVPANEIHLRHPPPNSAGSREDSRERRPNSREADHGRFPPNRPRNGPQITGNPHDSDRRQNEENGPNSAAQNRPFSPPRVPTPGHFLPPHIRDSFPPFPEPFAFGRHQKPGGEGPANGQQQQRGKRHAGEVRIWKMGKGVKI